MTVDGHLALVIRIVHRSVDSPESVRDFPAQPREKTAGIGAVSGVGMETTSRCDGDDLNREGA